MDNKYLIASIGRKVSTKNIEEEPTFMYNSQQYIQLIIWDKFNQILGEHHFVCLLNYQH